jgi:hypothetical protein
MTPYHRSRRCFLRRMGDLSMLAAVAACGANAKPVTLSPATVATIDAILLLVADVQAAVAAHTLTRAEAADAAIAIAAIAGEAAALGQGRTTPTAAGNTVLSVLGAMSAYLPLVPAVLALGQSVTAVPETPAQASLRLHMAQLRAAAAL